MAASTGIILKPLFNGISSVMVIEFFANQQIIYTNLLEWFSFNPCSIFFFFTSKANFFF